MNGFPGSEAQAAMAGDGARRVDHLFVREQDPVRVVVGAIDRGPVAGIPWTWERLYDIQDTEDVKEGFRSFVEKRKPKFVGR